MLSWRSVANGAVRECRWEAIMRTLSEAGPGGPDVNHAWLTTCTTQERADIVRNTRLLPFRSNVERAIKEIRRGVPPRSGSYYLNGHNCHHTKATDKIAILWHEGRDLHGRPCVVIEAFAEHSGRGNQYFVINP